MSEWEMENKVAAQHNQHPDEHTYCLTNWDVLKGTMFCMHCGKSCVANAKYCHNCGSKVDKSNIKKPQNENGESYSDSNVTQATSSGRMSFTQFRALKEEDRAKHFTKKNGKKLKLDPKGKASSKELTCKIQIGIMIYKNGGLRVKRGNNANLPLTLATNMTYDEILAKAVEKHHRFNKDLIKNEENKFYCLLYADKTKAEFLPGSDEPFRLQRYKEDIDKPYSKIVLYLCRCSEYFSAQFDELGCIISGDETSDVEAVEQSEQPVQTIDSSISKTVSIH